MVHFPFFPVFYRYSRLYLIYNPAGHNVAPKNSIYPDLPKKARES